MRDRNHTDPVAQNIRNQQNHDAMPTKEEVNRTPPCDKCEERRDSVERRPLDPVTCSRRQAPDVPFTLLCDDCESERDDWEERVLSKARKRNEHGLDENDIVAVGFSECENFTYIREPDESTIEVKEKVGRDYNDEPVYETKEVPDPHASRAIPTVPIECRCGEPLDRIVRLDEE